MEAVILFVKDFLLGTQLSDRLATIGKQVVFCERIRELPPEIEVVIIDLDEKGFGNADFISTLKAARPQLRSLGFMKQIRKQRLTELKAAGCSVIISQSSALKNIQNIILELTR